MGATANDADVLLVLLFLLLGLLLGLGSGSGRSGDHDGGGSRGRVPPARGDEPGDILALSRVEMADQRGVNSPF
jgi:hypothetical protein